MRNLKQLFTLEVMAACPMRTVQQPENAGTATISDCVRDSDSYPETLHKLHRGLERAVQLVKKNSILTSVGFVM